MANVHMRQIAREVRAFNSAPEEFRVSYAQHVQARFEKAGYSEGANGKYFGRYVSIAA